MEKNQQQTTIEYGFVSNTGDLTVNHGPLVKLINFLRVGLVCFMSFAPVSYFISLSLVLGMSAATAATITVKEFQPNAFFKTLLWVAAPTVGSIMIYSFFHDISNTTAVSLIMMHLQSIVLLSFIFS